MPARMGPKDASCMRTMCSRSSPRLSPQTAGVTSALWEGAEGESAGTDRVSASGPFGRPLLRGACVTSALWEGAAAPAGSRAGVAGLDRWPKSWLFGRPIFFPGGGCDVITLLTGLRRRAPGAPPRALLRGLFEQHHVSSQPGPVRLVRGKALEDPRTLEALALLVGVPLRNKGDITMRFNIRSLKRPEKSFIPAETRPTVGEGMGSSMSLVVANPDALSKRCGSSDLLN
jgi:hypothetical protein